MVQIRLLRSVAGRFDDKPFAYAKGANVEIPKALADDLCKSHNAELIKAAKPSKKRKTAVSKANSQKETR